jgi:hypothetical protein
MIVLVLIKFFIETKYQGNICRNFTQHGKCNRPNCPFLHEAPRDG